MCHFRAIASLGHKVIWCRFDASFSVQQALVSLHFTRHVIMMYRYIRRPVCVCAALVHAACGAKQYSELGAAVKSTSVLQTQHQVATWTCDMHAIGLTDIR